MRVLRIYLPINCEGCLQNMFKLCNSYHDLLSLIPPFLKSCGTGLTKIQIQLTERDENI